MGGTYKERGERERDPLVFLCEGIRLGFSYVRVGPVCIMFVKCNSNVLGHDEWQPGVYIPQHVLKLTLMIPQEYNSQGNRKTLSSPISG